MSEPILLLASAGRLGRFGEPAYTDFGTEYTLRARTVEVAPAGVGGACMFAATYLTISFNVPFSVRVTPILDGVEYWAEGVDIVVSEAPADGRPETHLFEIGWSLPYQREGSEREARYAMMGRWFQVEIWAPCPEIGGILDFEDVEHEFEIISESAGAGAR
jgi:hypothetical protein